MPTDVCEMKRGFRGAGGVGAADGKRNNQRVISRLRECVCVGGLLACVVSLSEGGGVRGQCLAPSSVSEEARVRTRTQATPASPLSCRNTLQQTLTPNLLFPIKKPGSQTSSVLIRVRLRYCWKCACIRVAGFLLDYGSRCHSDMFTD